MGLQRCPLLRRVYGSSNLPWAVSTVERRLPKSLKKQEYRAKTKLLMFYARSMRRKELCSYLVLKVSDGLLIITISSDCCGGLRKLPAVFSLSMLSVAFEGVDHIRYLEGTNN